jgi:DNA-binding response OmpR family regulator
MHVNTELPPPAAAPGPHPEPRLEPVRPAARRGHPQSRPAARQTKRILLADDDPGVREMLGRVLESEGYEVVTAQTGLETVRKFAAASPDLVLLDLNMPEKDGWEAFGMICEKHPFVPVIVITARPHQYAQAIELGVDALMEKPLNLPLLLDSIRCLLAETEVERTRRLINPEFKTTLLADAGTRHPQHEL